MASRRDRFTSEEHLVAGEKLRTISNDLSLIGMSAYDAYGTPLFRRYMKVEKALRELRSALDSKICGEYPMGIHTVEGIHIVNAYYQPRPDIPDSDHLTGDSNTFREKLRELAGLDKAPSQDRKAGRPRVLDHERLEKAKKLVSEEKLSVDEASKKLNIATSTLYRYLARNK
jgi:hypothetical protein